MSTTEDFHATRRKGIGGSDAAAVLGVSPWKSPFDLFQEKTGLVQAIENPPTPAMEWGLILEDPIAAKYAEETGRKVRRQRQAKKHKDHPWMICHLDRSVDPVPGEPRRIVEIKTVGRYGRLEDWGEEGSDELPVYYLAQAHHNMAVTGAEVCDVPVLIGGSDYRCYTVERDESIAADLIERERVFWMEHVEKLIAPDDEGPGGPDRRWLFSSAGSVEATSEDVLALARLGQILDEIDGLEAEADTIRDKIKDRIADGGDAITVPIGARMRKAATWKTQTAWRFDSEAFKARHPEVHAAFRKASASRPFRVTRDVLRALS